jgi:4-carboxymuconolactone decarboxylase
MKATTTLALALAFGATDVFAETGSQTGALTRNDVIAVAPVLERYANDTVADGLWKRPGLSPRDRSIVTVSAVITRNQPILLGEQLRLALDHGVKPAELSEIITHLAFYAGWGNAMAAVAVAKDVFSERGISQDQLPKADVTLLPLDEKTESVRAAIVEKNTGPASPGLVRDTRDVLFRDLWLRPGLAPRDRSLVTLSALVSAGQVAQIPYHLNRAMDNGLTRDEAAEMISHLAYYAGWPNAFSAAAVAREFFEKPAAP